MKVERCLVLKNGDYATIKNALSVQLKRLKNDHKVAAETNGRVAFYFMLKIAEEISRIEELLTEGI